MKRLCGVAFILAGLSGCISFTSPAQGDKKAGQPKYGGAAAPLSVSAPPPLNVPGASATLPTNPTWTSNPSSVSPSAAAAMKAGESAIARGNVGGTPAAAKAAETPKPLPAAPALASAKEMPKETPTAKPSEVVLTGGTSQSAPGTPETTIPIKDVGPPPLPPGMLGAFTPGKPKEAPTSVVNGGVKTEALKPLPSPAVPPAPPVPPAPLWLPPGALPGTMETAKATPPPPVPVPVATGDTKPTPAKGGAPLMRLVNTKRITLNFEVKDIGPSGLASVDLWFTQDGKDWKKHAAPPTASAYVVEVDEEGMYGFTLVAKSGLGLGGEAPAAGDQPMVWVIVDLSKPEVALTEVKPVIKEKKQEVHIAWTANDKNLGRTPVSLYYAEKSDGPWKVIAANVENTGKHTWSVEGVPPAMFFVKVEATDLAGNVGEAKSIKPVPLDSSKPRISITNVVSTPGG